MHTASRPATLTGMTYQPTRFLDGSCNEDARCTQRWGHPGPCITPPLTTRTFRKTDHKEHVVDGMVEYEEYIDWKAEFDSTGDVRWYCDDTQTGEEIGHSPEHIAQLIAEVGHDGYREV